MRIAFSGSHRTGKTTLVEAIASLMPGYAVIDEPYRILEESGHEFADPPSVEDYEAQLRTSIELVAAAPPDALVDRCPLDLAAYLQASDGEIDDHVDDMRDAMTRIDLVVVVPIETPDRIAVADHEDRRLRRRVDERLQRLALDDPFGFEAATLEVSGDVAQRVAQVMRAIRARG